MSSKRVKVSTILMEFNIIQGERYKRMHTSQVRYISNGTKGVMAPGVPTSTDFTTMKWDTAAYVRKGTQRWRSLNFNCAPF